MLRRRPLSIFSFCVRGLSYYGLWGALSLRIQREAVTTWVTSSQTTAPPLSVVLVTWTPPSPGFIKLNVDASWEASLGSGFVGVVARNNAGGFLGAGRYSVKAQSVAMAEALAVKIGCELGHQLGWHSVVLEPDSSKTILALRDSPSKGRWEAFPLLQQCIRLGDSFHVCC
ncbi:uncharacterized protein [Pyrus communis]|uniref:uncharacterized protein n=1 Tax=Pyrus communis TaxID=23211 RepID=UPI0035C0E5CE